MVLAFAAAGLMMIGNNVFASEDVEDPNDHDEEYDGGGDGSLVDCYTQIWSSSGKYRACLSCKMEPGSGRIQSMEKCTPK